MKLAIVGMGISGSSVLKHLYDLNALTEEDQVDVYEPRDQIAVGFAYQSDDLLLLMNSYSKRLSLNEANPDEFMEWLATHHPEYVKDDFVPRPIFGQYVNEKYRPYLDQEAVTWYHQEVKQIRIKDDNHFMLYTDQQAQGQEYDWIFLTIGHPPYADHYNLLGHDHYIHNPYPVSQTLNQIDPSHKVGIIGSSLTGIDIMHYLQEHYHFDHPVRFFIRYSPFTNVKSRLYPDPIALSIDEQWISEQKERHQGQIPLKVIFDQIQADMAQNQVDLLASVEKYQNGSVQDVRYQIQQKPIDLQIMQRYVGLLTAYLPDLNMALSPANRQLFHQKYKRLFEHYRTQFPDSKMSLILKWFDQGRLQIISHIDQIQPTDTGQFQITTRDGLQYRMDTVINATGFEQNLVKAGQQVPLIKDLLEQEIIMQNPLGGIQITWPGAHPISPRYGEIRQMSLSGLVIHQTQFGNNNAQMTARHGKNMVLDYIQAQNN